MTPMEMARKAVNYLPETDYPPILHTKEQIENFAVLAAEATKEKAAKLIDSLYKHDRKESGYDEGWNDALDIAEQAIRSMK